MDKSRISSSRGTVFAAVTKEVVQQTPIYKTYLKDKSKYKIQNILNAALFHLGYDIEGDKGYTTTQDVVVRSAKDSTKGYKTDVYTFPVRANHRKEFFYENTVLFNIESEENVELVDLAEFGLEHYETSPRKENKAKTREQLIDELLMNSNNNNEYSTEI